MQKYKRQRRGAGHNAKGRSKGGERFVKLPYWLLDSPAWLALKPAARSLYVELSKRYNGSNNGEISMSVREAAKLVRIAKDTATKTFYELEEKGFILRNECGSFNWKLRHATTWFLTQHPVHGVSPTKEFMRWRAEKSKKPVPGGHRSVPRQGRDRSKVTEILVLLSSFWDCLLCSAICSGPKSLHAYNLPCHESFAAGCPSRTAALWSVWRSQISQHRPQGGSVVSQHKSIESFGWLS